ncbi:MAG: hypothetical protein QG587_1571 [Chloroflexota bacterium]|nr:hypothetical protein [Chloroflexota bacterium]
MVVSEDDLALLKRLRAEHEAALVNRGPDQARPRDPRCRTDLGRRAALEAVVVKHDLRIGDDIGGRFTPKAT